MSADNGKGFWRRLHGDVRFGVLGPVTVTDGPSALNIGGPKQRTVLAVLIAQRGDPVSIDTIIDSVWGDDAAPNAKRIAQTYVATLRSVVGEAIVKSGPGWRLVVDRSQVDAAQFEDLYESARDLLEANPQRASVALREALGMWRGIPYSDVEAHGALQGEVARLSELRVAAQAARISADLAQGRDADLIGEIEALMAVNPYSERFRAQHMLALYRAGRQKEALRSYEQMRSVLLEELGVDPTPDLQDLEQKILDQDDSLRVAATQTIKRCAILVADPGDPIEIGHLPANERDQLLRRSSEALRSSIDRAGDGHSVTAGTTTYVIFEDALTAARAAEMVTRRLDESGMRLAIDWGDLLLEDDRVTGPPVSRAAVMAAVAHKGQVLLSVDAHQAIAASGNGRGLRFENLGSYDLHGLEGELLVYQLLVGDLPRTFPELEVHRLPPPLPGGGDRSVPGYELREAIAPGSVGTLYRAFQPSVGREVLIEVIGRADSSQPGFVRSFEADAQRLSLLDHQNIAQVIDYWRQPDGAFIVYRFPRGGLLDGADVEDPNRLIDQVGSALVHGHSLGMVHGSIRPDRVALDEAGNASLLCFPMAGVSSTHVDVYSDYLAPELKTDHRPTPESDLYALGVLARNHGLADFPAVDRATDPDPGARHGSVADFLIELNPVGVDSPSSRYTQARNPYKGLAAFHEKDARDFHGRRVAVDELVGALGRSHLLTLVGPSGIGKSSAVRAGLIPGLRSGRIEGSERWLITDMLPGSHPFLELQRALERVATALPVELTERLADHDPLALDGIASAMPEETELVVLVDQFEELFTLVPDGERRAFLALLERAAQNRTARFVLTLRADFLDRPLRHPTFGKMIKESTIMLSAPSPDELAEVVVQPARGVGVEVAPELVERIVSEVRDQAGALPLVQHALTELFDSRSSDLLGLTDFEGIGGVGGSVARRAEGSYRALGEDEQGRARQVFLRLVTIVDNSEPTRRRTRLADLEDLEAGATIDTFTRSRLLVLDNDPETRSPTVEVAHEALLSAWPRLANWIEAAREELALARRLDEARLEWVESGNDPAYLLTGGRLAQHETWSSSTSLAITQAQREYLEASREHDERLRARSRRRRNWVTAGFAAAAAIAAVSAFSASESADRAKAEELAANAVAQVGTDPQLSLLLTTTAFERSQSVAVQSALHAGIQASREVMVIPPPEGSVGAGAILDPAGQRVAVAGMDSSTMQLWQLGAKNPEWSVVLTDDRLAQYHRFSHFWFSDDGERIYVPLGFSGGVDDRSGDGPGIYVLNSENGTVLDFRPVPCLARAMPAGTHFVRGDELFAFDGTQIRADGTCDLLNGIVGVIDLGGDEVTVEMDSLGPLAPPTISDDGRYLAIHGFFDDPEVLETRVFDTTSGVQVFREFELSGAISWDGSRILLGGTTSYLYDVLSGDRIQAFQTGRNPRFWFSPDETLAMTPTVSGAVKIFDVETGVEVFNLLGHTSQIRDVAMDQQQNLLVSSGFDAARVWDISASTRGDMLPIEVGDDIPYYEDAVTVGEDLLLLRRGQASFFLDPVPHQVELRLKPGNELLWTREVHAAELGGEGTVVLLPIEEVYVTSPSGLSPARHIGRPVLVDGLDGKPIVDLEGCDFFYHVFDSGDVAVERGADCIGGGPVEPYTWFEFSADGSRVLGSTDLGATTVWDTGSGRAIASYAANRTGPNLFGQGVRWAATLSGDGSNQLLPPTQDEWERFETDGTRPSMSVVDLAMGDEIGSFPIDHWANFATFTPDGRTLVVAGTDLVVVDTDTWRAEVLERPQGARITDLAVSRNGRLAATVSQDDTVVVWNLDARSVFAEIPILGDIGGAINGVGFLDDETIVVATQAGGPLLRFTLDSAELLGIALDSLNRPLTHAECATYDIDPCPTLEEMRQRVSD